MKRHSHTLFVSLGVAAAAGLAWWAWGGSALSEGSGPVAAPPRASAVSSPVSDAQEAATASVRDSAGTSSGATQRIATDIPVFEPGVKVVPLEQQQLPGEWKARLRAQLKNLHDTGSLSGGKMTHEFQRMAPMADKLRTKGLDQLLSQLAIQSTQLGAVLGPSFMLVGADVQGKTVGSMGVAGFFQIHRQPTTGQMVELSENQLDVLGGDGTVIAPEFDNDRVAQYPATLETLSDSEGATLHNLQWFVQNRVFQLTTRNMSADEIRQIALAITQRYVAMPFEGWRSRYEYDPENPAHRVARPNPKDQGRW